MKYIKLTAIVFTVLAAAMGCSLDQFNPNAPTTEEVLSTADGIKAIAIGLQAQYGETINETIEVSNLITRQYATMPASVLGLRELETGGADVQGFNGTVNSFWNSQYRVIKTAEDLINNVGKVPLDPGTASGILALARLIKAMSLGELIEAFVSVPIEVTTSPTPAFSNRATVLATVISLLEAARDGLAATPPSADFNSNILGIGFNLPNTINAMLARYALIAGDNAKALAAANAVDLTKTSTLFYNSATARNPIFLVTVQIVYYKPVDDFRLNAEPGDRRVAFWVSAVNENSFLGKPVDNFVQYRLDNSPYFVYLPGEMTLIKAEAYARQNDLANALIELNKVRTKTTDAAGIGAGLPAKTAADLPTQAAMLDEIYKQRCYELFVTGLRWGDTRRFGKAGAETDPATRSRTRNWLPYPDAERAANPNTPPDPAI
ncbi:MAG: RagB/SusD family nutrient uptake outer membrane protein [candidate division KSB1 bacterium]|nr:RagB/SusD family nutrient uptake outer membrane protein [candidate division KSB1 bacterium]MDZ7365021.1 RagB/SusD family nutrient uptake outer membrane protein [candidate division KSB1 bacterium]MDZ7403416.1 RagB/SusD family nutrient uptake outer membrane protein [candidate division KSB1 bacterium]